MKLWKWWQKKEEQERIGATPGALYPKNDLEEEEIKFYKESLDIALKDDRINNIAITAPYGIGKSTILESYFRSRKKYYPSYIQKLNGAIRKINKYKQNNFFSPNLLNEIDDYEFISLPNFFDNMESNELQKKVVEQLLFKSNPQKYPFSKLKRIKDTSLIRDIAILLLFSFIIGTSLYLYSKATDKSILLIASLSFFNPLDIFLAILVCVFLLFFLVVLIRKVRISLSKSTVGGKGTIGPFEFSSSPEENNNELDIFNMFSEELLYYFRKTRTKIVIFEDLDRFGKPEIFQELRELNININKRQPKVVFIYSLQDKIFEKIIENDHDIEALKVRTLSDNRVRSKAKFFDYVIPIFPVTSLYNSSSTIEKELSKYDIMPENIYKQLDLGFIRSVGLYLKDHRMITLIVSEFNTYLEILNSKTKSDIDLKVLFSMVIYKNFYADDFEKIGYGNSLLNIIFDDSHNLYSKLIDIKNQNLEKEKADLEDQIARLQHHLDYEVNAILRGYYHSLKDKYRIKDTNVDNQYFIVNSKSYITEDVEGFFSDIAVLEESTIILTKDRSYSGYEKKFTVKDAFTVGGESSDIRSLIQSNSYEKSTSTLLMELTSKINQIRNQINKLANDTYQLSIGTILRELSECYEKNDETKNALQEIRGDDFKRFLFFNDYLTQNFYSYISPVEFSENPKDSMFISRVLSYNDMQDYSLVNIENTIKELDLAGANYSFAYSSNLLSYLLNIEGNHLKKSLIIDKMIEKNDFEFWDKLLSYSKKNNLNFLEGFKLLPKKSKSFFLNSFAQISEANNIISIKAIIENFKEITVAVGDSILQQTIAFLINDTNSFSNIINTLRKLEDINIVNDNKEYFLIKEVLPIVEATNNRNNRELIEYIYREALYKETCKNIENFGVLFDIKSSFELYTKKFREIDIKYLSTNTLYNYFESLYCTGAYESYSGLEEFIDFSTGKHSFYVDFVDESLPEVDIKQAQSRCLLYFIKISFIEEDYESNKRILEKLDLISLIDNGLAQEQVVLQLINLHRIYYSFELLRVISIKVPDLVTTYLLSVYTVYPELFTKYLEEIKQFLTDKEMLYLIKNLNLQENYLKIGSLLSGDIEIWKNLLQDDQKFFDKKMTDKIIQLNNFSLHRLMFQITNKVEQAKFLHILLTKFPKQLSLSEFEKILGIDPYFSTMTPDGRVYHSNNSAISENVIDVLSDLGVIGYRNGKKDFVLKKEVNYYFS